MSTLSQSSHSRGAVLVVLQFLALTVLALHAGPALRWWPSAVILALCALVMVMSLVGIGRDTIRLHPLPSEKGRLQTGGMYRWVRHPMYAAVLAASLVIVGRQPSLLSVAALLLAGVVLYSKIGMEEAALREKFPDYEAYSKRVPALVPFLPRRKCQGR